MDGHASPRLICFTQCSLDENTIVTAEDYTGDELKHIIDCLKADYEVVRGKRPYEDKLLPGHIIRFENMPPGEALSIGLWPQEVKYIPSKYNKKGSTEKPLRPLECI